MTSHIPARRTRLRAQALATAAALLSLFGCGFEDSAPVLSRLEAAAPAAPVKAPEVDPAYLPRQFADPQGEIEPLPPQF